MEEDITQAILEQLPQHLLPDTPHVQINDIRVRLDQIDRQQAVLEIASWLHQNREILSEIAFEFLVYDERVYIDKDEIVVTDLVENNEDICASVNHLCESLDDRINDNNEGFFERLLTDLNKVGWELPAAWDVLEKHVALKGPDNDASKWLGSHRAAWEAADIEHATPTPANHSPRVRM